MPKRHLLKLHAKSQLRRAVIDELHFTYKQLQRLLPLLVRRVDPQHSALILQQQIQNDRRSFLRLVQVAMDLGQPPGPRLCADASDRIHQLYHLDRSIEDRTQRSEVVATTLMELRCFIVQLWSRLIENEPEEMDPEVHQEVLRLQLAAADQQRELVHLLNILRNPSQGLVSIRSA